MAICDHCGELIVFRYMDGRPTPIHVNGNWCRGYRETGAPRETGSFRTIRSYVNPDALCPVCGQTVFFYQAPNGGRVFFDAPGWPWPKHGCTDNRQQVRRVAKRDRSEKTYAFRARDGARLALFDLDDFEEHGAHYKFVFRRHDTRKIRTGLLRKTTFAKAGLELDDFFDAPSFVVDLDKSDEGGLRVDFICARLGTIVRIRMSRNGP